MNIFITVGAQLPFMRLVSIFDKEVYNNIFNVQAQVGNDLNKYKYIKSVGFIDQEKYIELIGWSDIVVSHAGMGTILTCLEYDKPLIILPRSAELNEHRNDHQIDTITSLDGKFSNVKSFLNHKDLELFLSSLTVNTDISEFFGTSVLKNDLNKIGNSLSEYLSDYINESL